MNTTTANQSAGWPRVYVALHQGTSFIGRLIKWQTRGPYSHASFVFERSLNAPLILFEAREFRGVQTREAGSFTRLFFPEAVQKEKVDLFKIEGMTPEIAEQLQKWALGEVGKPYDYTMVARFISRRQASRKQSGKWFCSEFVFAGLKKFGIELHARTEPWEVAPSLLGRSTKLVPGLTL